ncbi:DUF7919 family protein [Micromonospora rubida]
MYYADLSAYEYDSLAGSCSMVLNVGWLDISEPFTSGTVPVEFLQRLSLLVKSPINLTRGSHPCTFCLAELRSNSRDEMDGKLVIQTLRSLGGLGNGEIVVVDENDVCHVAPMLISHYVERHGYQPPSEFVDAVLQNVE